MRAVILTAGRGRRLQKVTGERPSIAIVTGFGGVDVRRICGPTIDYVHDWHACTHIVPALDVPARSARRSSHHV
jgi:hypothetical protein